MGDTINLSDPETYRDGPPHEAFAEWRQTSPVLWQDIEGEPGYWAVLRHADCVEVARNSDRFSASEGGVVIEDLDDESLARMRDMLLAMDPPRHTDYRKPLSPRFKARVIAGLEDRIRDICRGIFATAKEQRDVEFVQDVTSSLPAQVIGELMGLPEEDWGMIHELAERNTRAQDPDFFDEDGPDHSGSVEMGMYAYHFAMERRSQPPRDDLTTLILESDFGGKQMTDADFASFFIQLVTAGNDTTKGMLSASIVALVEHPDQLAALRANPAGIADAVEEILRFENPLHYFRRTATVDTELGGQAIAKGDKVAMLYTSANRDEAVYTNSQQFDISRNPNPHLSFGIATHFCLGVHLARLEGRVFLEEMLNTFSGLELTGEPVRTRSNLNNSYKTVPARLTV